MSERSVALWVMYMWGMNLLLFGVLFQIEGPTAVHYGCFFAGSCLLYAAGLAKGGESR